ncbi:hypothetical protein LOD99_12847 [Oopsacas minuta]|uniref:Uncharacterized protein n=1 Tax=Oopsacas minuta TaxID=111878 RepID=A0AAV7JD65_9METZ|nr:hypothetical protein LOD99_12847 [Oopsacas minuta]
MDQLGVDKSSNIFNRRQLEASLKIAMNTREGKQGIGTSQELDPFTKAVNYLEKHEILNHMETIAAKVCFNKPADPIEFMLKEILALRNN